MKRFAVIPHVNPDADAIGSATALVAGLRQLGHEAHMLAQWVPPHLRSIPGAEDYVQHYEADVAVAVDCASLDRLGGFQELFDATDNLVIDHHVSNPGFGKDNIIRDAESTTLILYDLFEEWGVTIDRDIAHCLYAGLVTDTGGFRWGSPRMHEVAASLVAHGVDTQQIARDLMDELNAVDLQQLGAALADVEIDNNVAVVAVRLGSMDLRAVEKLIHLVQGLDAEVIAVCKESTPGQWSVSLRSRVRDVAALAVSQGGGGHLRAAGFSCSGTRDEVVELVKGVI